MKQNWKFRYFFCPGLWPSKMSKTARKIHKNFKIAKTEKKAKIKFAKLQKFQKISEKIRFLPELVSQKASEA